MRPQTPSLWRASARWRWLVCGSLTALALAIIGGPWRSPSANREPLPYARYDAGSANPGSSATTTQPPDGGNSSSGMVGGGVAAVTGTGNAPGAQAVAPSAELPALAPSPIGRTHQGTLQVGGRNVRLPEGTWTMLARFTGRPQDPGESVLLGRIEGSQMRRMIAIRAHHGALPDTAQSAAPFAACARDDTLHRHVDVNERSGPQRCWWVNHATGLWGQQAIFKAARLELSQRGIEPAEVWINVGFRRFDAGGYVTAFHYFDPLEDGIASSVVAWAESEWHRSRIAADARRSAYVVQRKAWGEGWAPLFFAAR